jgi:uncharacterized protein (DUF1499 family)
MISSLFSRGAEGVPVPAPLDFTRLQLPASPNTCLLTPSVAPGQGHLHRDPLPASPEAVMAALDCVAANMPRTFPLARFPARNQAQWVVRSALMNYPDIVVAEAAQVAGGTGLWLYSRSLIGWSDMGVNRARVMTWLEALEAALRAG